MKVQIKDLYPNPYRDMDNYPINREKVETLKASIKQTGFWDNIVARNMDGKIQIAYGHHRLTALREALPWDTEVDIPVKDLPDSVMIQIMANENMEEYRTGPAIIDETVRVAKKYLEEHPEEKMNLSAVDERLRSKNYPIGAKVIASFLNWPESRVSYSLERLNLEKSGMVNRQAINKLPTERSARDFVKAAQKWELPVEEHESVVDEIMRTENYGFDQVEKVVSEAKYKNKPKERKEEYEREIKTIQFNNYCVSVFSKSVDLHRQLDILIEHKEQFNYLSMSDVKDARTRLEMLSSLKNLARRINKLIDLIKDENNSN
jgi:hypothetical protein